MKLLRSYAVAFSHSGAALASIARDVVVWDVANRQKHFRAHLLKHASSCVFHPDDTRIAVRNTSGQIVVADAADGSLLRSFKPAREERGADLHYSPCGEYLVHDTWDGRLVVLSETTGEVVLAKEFRGEMITGVSRSADGMSWLALHWPKVRTPNAPDGLPYISVWKWPFSTPVNVIPLAEQQTAAAVLSPDGERACVLELSRVALIRVADGQLLASMPYASSGVPDTACWSPDGAEIAVVQRDGIAFHDGMTLQVRATLALPFASDVRYSPDGTLVALGSWQAGRLAERAALG